MGTIYNSSTWGRSTFGPGCSLGMFVALLPLVARHKP